MQKGCSVTWCAGFSKGSPSSLPMKKLPPGIAIIPCGHVSGTAPDAEPDAAAEADDDAEDAEAGAVGPDFALALEAGALAGVLAAPWR